MSPGLDGALALDLEVAAIKNDWQIHGVVVDRADSAVVSGVALILRLKRRPPWGVVRWQRQGEREVTFSSGRYDLSRTHAVADFRARSH